MTNPYEKEMCRFEDADLKGEVILPQAKKCQQSPGAERGKEETLP